MAAIDGEHLQPPSVLFEYAEDSTTAREPTGREAFRDLQLEQIVAAVTAGRAEYDLAPLFRAAASSPETVAYRHEVARDLETVAVARTVRDFAARMVSTRTGLRQARSLHHELQRQRWQLTAAATYCQAVAGLSAGLDASPLESRALLALRGYLRQHVDSAAFQGLNAEAVRLTADLERVRYQLHLKRSAVVVSRSADESDYSAEIDAVFARFRQGEARDYRIAVESSPEVNQLEGAILDRVARLHPETFDALRRFADRHRSFLDSGVTRFDREVQVYLSYFDHIRPLREAGLPFCYPAVGGSKALRATGTFDLALAAAAVAEGRDVVRNDFHLDGAERIFVVTGPNQGGKTTFARTFGQLHHLAALGLPVPGEQARLFLFDRLFTHFGREEDPEDLRGKLKDDLVRTRAILDRASSDSIVIMNEVFNSTTLRDATVIGRRVLTEIAARDLLCVFVTFIDELAAPDGVTVSLVSTVDPADPAIRTYRVVRAPADGRAYAAAIAAKYRLSYQDLRTRLTR
ncbi:hypothetical protein [Kribbella sp. HUAS MG21]|uniref:DNA mismatch repair proteins mutS family domain-containing protein n=1 Tax=Kribbella sp. HUAS MG21 TaxID=3160966 RepID=A0AAU7T6B3_9ACTN